MKQGEQRIAILAADNPQMPDTVVVDESIQIYGVVIYINAQNFHHLKMVEILITSGLPAPGAQDRWR